MLTRSLSNPGTSTDLFLKSSRYYKEDRVIYRPKVTTTDDKKHKVEVGNLEYFFNRSPYELCLGSKSVKDGKWKPMENDEVSVEEKVCKVNNSCKLDYGKILFLNSNEKPLKNPSCHKVTKLLVIKWQVKFVEFCFIYTIL